MNTRKRYSFSELGEDAKCDAWNNWKFDGYYVNLAKEENEEVLKFFEQLMDIKVTRYDWFGCELDFDFDCNDESVSNLQGEQLRKYLKPIIKTLEEQKWYESEYKMYYEVLWELRRYAEDGGNDTWTFTQLVNLCLQSFFEAWIDDEDKDSCYNSFEENYAANYWFCNDGRIIEEKTK